VSTAQAAFPPLTTPDGFTQFLWRSSRLKVAGQSKELVSIGPKPSPEKLAFSVTLLDGRRLTVSVVEEAAFSG
jgi:hypothetical protein